MSDASGYTISVPDGVPDNPESLVGRNPGGLDPGGAKTAALAAYLAAQGIPVHLAARGRVTVGAVTVAGMGTAAAQLFATFGCGVELDVAAEPPVLRPRPDLARGTVETRWPDGHTEQRAGLQTAQVGYVLRTALATTGR
ncbi:MAG TPA: hypothetical protein VFW71_00485 [Actinomycetota bacterium]|nr:hypothetical protein [Actinomycetota bacterium]